MSRKSKRNQKHREAPAPAAATQPAAARRAFGRRTVVIGAAVALLLVVVAGTYFYTGEAARTAQQVAAKNRELLAGGDAPEHGSPDAKVRVVEFLDPACGTCALFYPEVKKLMAENPGRIRLSVRHVPFHKGADQVVRILEAARKQGMYWQTLEALFASQDQWTIRHQVDLERVWPSLQGIGLDLDRIRSDMGSPEITGRMERDFADARALGVTQTPEYFVNGRPLPSFGLEELKALVKEEVRVAYP